MNEKTYTSGQLLKRFIPYFKPYKNILIFDLICALLTTICEIVLPMIMRHITNTALVDVGLLSAKLIGGLGALYLALRIVDALSNYYMANMGHVMGAMMETDMRRDAYEHLLKLSDTYYNNTEKDGLPEGAILGSLNTIAAQHPEILAPYYNALASKGDGVTHFNTTFVQDGIVLYIPRNKKAETTVQLMNLLRTNVEMLFNRRLLIILEDGAEASMLICDHAVEKIKTLSVQVAEVFLGCNASFDLYELEETQAENRRINQLFVRQQAGSHFNHTNITLTNGVTRNSAHVSLEGEGAEVNMYGLAISDKQQQVENNTLVDHKVGHCASNELYKYVLDDSAKGVFAGKMLIRKDAQQTVSHQTNRNLCLTKSAHIYTQPQLEIYADDVKCSHGSTVGQLDENALFYMQQRGIPKEEARHLLMFAFAGEVIDAIKIDALRERLHILVEKRFRGELNRCKGCSLCK